HRFVFSYLYELPIGHGKRTFGNASGVLNQIVGGWQVGGITSVSSGNWFTILDDNGVANSDGQQRPDLVGDPRAKSCMPNTFFNTCAFADPPAGSFGDVSRNSVQGPGYQIWDFSLFKNFPISERTKLEFRAEFFNVFNHPNLQFAKSGPQNSINTTTFGTPELRFLAAVYRATKACNCSQDPAGKRGLQKPVLRHEHGDAERSLEAGLVVPNIVYRSCRAGCLLSHL